MENGYFKHFEKQKKKMTSSMENGYFKLLKPKGDAVEILAWNKHDRKILLWLINSIVLIIQDSIASLNSVLDLWHDLEERFGHTGCTNEAWAHELRKNIALQVRA